MPRRITILLFFATAILILSGTLIFGALPQYGTPTIIGGPLSHDAQEENTAGNLKTGPEGYHKNNHPSTTQRNSLKVTITETGGSHDEVVAALVHSFGSQPDVTIDLYQLLPRYGIIDIMNSFSLSQPIPTPKSPSQFQTFGMKNARPNLFVAGTCELDIVDNSLKQSLETLLKEGRTYLFCVVHHADRWTNPKLEAAIRPWVEKGMVEFWSLSPHTAKFLKSKSISQWKSTTTGVEPLVRYFVPVFPVKLPAKAQANKEMAFGMQGDYDPSRRDYASIFKGLATFLDDGDDLVGRKVDNITMHLLGHGNRPSVPEAISSHVIFDERLSYAEYYSILSNTFALLPAFATKEYLDRKASSSVPAALIAGTPLVASQSLIDAYSYINKDTVWIQADNEDDLDVVGKILKLDPDDRQSKKEAVKKQCVKIIHDNVRVLGNWIEEARKKI